ncbi:MAG: DUF2158 domain-containing protein [Serratia marcescens]|uniref:DUF2158 domain-containing protein n=1 Tax=Serratia nevei TaxID=2703794 RepID=UPI002913139E|nr:DUF2158 domain-containing protein [Serratia marcescens]
MSKSATIRKPKFKLGDAVYLKVGGPEMSVNEVHQLFNNEEFKGTYKCQWFAGKKLESGNFAEESLTSTNPKP